MLPLPDLLRPHDHILFEGDSITNAFRKPEEVCNAYQLGAGYATIIAAQTLAAHPQDDLRFSNRGVSGEGVGDLLARWEADCLTLKPDVLSIFVGVNDSHANRTLASFEKTYRELLTLTRERLPEVRLILGAPFYLPVPSEHRERVGVRERGDIVRQLAVDFGARLVPLQEIFDEALTRAPAEYWAFDGVHPTAQGHWLIAEAWLRAAGGASNA